MGKIRDLFCKFETYLGKFDTYFDNSRLMGYFYKFEIYRVKIRIFLKKIFRSSSSSINGGWHCFQIDDEGLIFSLDFNFSSVRRIVSYLISNFVQREGYSPTRAFVSKIATRSMKSSEKKWRRLDFVFGDYSSNFVVPSFQANFVTGFYRANQRRWCRF